MSLIHEALEKLEQEKKDDSASSPEPIFLEKGKDPIPRRRRIIYEIAGSLVFLFLLGLVYLQVNFSRTSDFERKGPSVSVSSPSSKLVSSGFLSPMNKNRFSITGITRVGADWTAIINNQLVRVGDRVSGATVKTIQADQVVLDFNGQTLALSLYGETPLARTT